MYLIEHIEALSTIVMLFLLFIAIVLMYVVMLFFNSTLFKPYGALLILLMIVGLFSPADETVCWERDTISGICTLEVSASFITLLGISYLISSVIFLVVTYVKEKRARRLELERLAKKEKHDLKTMRFINEVYALSDEELESRFDDVAKRHFGDNAKSTKK